MGWPSQLCLKGITVFRSGSYLCHCSRSFKKDQPSYICITPLSEEHRAPYVLYFKYLINTSVIPEGRAREALVCDLGSGGTAVFGDLGTRDQNQVPPRGCVYSECFKDLGPAS